MAKFKAGELLVIETGEYSDSGWHGPVKIIQDFEGREVAEAYRSEYVPEYEGDTAGPGGFLGFLAGKGFVEHIDCRSVHVGSYGHFESEGLEA